jgi:hypothetical protein
MESNKENDMPKHQDNEDDFDEQGLLRDGRTYRVPLRMMDGVSRAIADHIKQTVDITDHFGDASLGLHRPGFRKLDGGNEGDAILRKAEMRDRAEAYQDYERDAESGWKTDAWGAQNAGDVCTINGNPGHLKMVNGEMTCVPDAKDAVSDLRDQANDAANAYSAYEDELAEAWRRGK